MDLSRVWSDLTTATSAGRHSSSVSSGANVAWRKWSSVQSATIYSRGGYRVVEKRKNDYDCRLRAVHGSLFQQRHQVQYRGGLTTCGSIDESRSSGLVAVVSDDDVEIHRNELLAHYWDEGTEAARITVEKDDDAPEADDSTEGGQDDELVRRRAATRAPRFLVIGSEEENQLEKRFWWKSPDVRRILTPRTKGLLLLNILTFLYGSNISIIKSAGTTMDPTLFSVGRFTIASLVFTPFLRHAFTNKSLRKASVELGLLASAGYLTQCISVLTSDASRVSFISTFTVIVVPLLAGLSGAKISKITWIAAATALVGVGILESGGTAFTTGDLWSFVSAVMFGVHMLRTEHHSKTFAHGDSLPVIALQLVVITICSGAWFCTSHFSSDDLVTNLPASNWPSIWANTVSLPWLPMLYTGLLSTAFCLWTELVSLRDVKATEAAVIYTTEPLWGAAFAWLTLGERWGPNGWLGAFFILGGSLLMQLFGHPDTPGLKKIVLLPSSIDLVDAVDSSIEEKQHLIRAKERDVSTENLHKQKPRAREPVRASRRNE